MQLVDIGVNLTHPSFAGDRQALLQRAQAAGVEQLVLTGTSLADNEQAHALCLELDDTASRLFCTELSAARMRSTPVSSPASTTKTLSVPLPANISSICCEGVPLRYTTRW